MAKKVYFEHGPLSVTSKFVRFRSRSIKIDTLEAIEVTRPIFWYSSIIALGLSGFALAFVDLLYVHEIALFLAAGIALLAVTSRIGTLTVRSKLMGTRGWSVHWWIAPLWQMGDAVQTALSEKGRKTVRTGGGVTVTDDDNEEDEDDDE